MNNHRAVWAAPNASQAFPSEHTTAELAIMDNFPDSSFNDELLKSQNKSAALKVDITSG